jgi:hypothetical protein
VKSARSGKTSTSSIFTPPRASRDSKSATMVDDGEDDPVGDLPSSPLTTPNVIVTSDDGTMTNPHPARTSSYMNVVGGVVATARDSFTAGFQAIAHRLSLVGPVREAPISPEPSDDSNSEDVEVFLQAGSATLGMNDDEEEEHTRPYSRGLHIPNIARQRSLLSSVSWSLGCLLPLPLLGSSNHCGSVCTSFKMLLG